jgi:hypothetical protein
VCGWVMGVCLPVCMCVCVCFLLVCVCVCVLLACLCVCVCVCACVHIYVLFTQFIGSCQTCHFDRSVAVVTFKRFAVHTIRV